MAEKTFCGCCIVKAYAETNTPQGGDGGHGGETSVSFSMEGGDINFDVVGSSLALVARGDDECEQLIQAFQWLADTLREQQIKNWVRANG